MTGRQKLPLQWPSEAAEELVTSLGSGEATSNGDRTSQYIDVVAEDGGPADSTIKVALVEQKSGLDESEWGYALHVINDIDRSPCQIMETEKLDMKQLRKLLSRVIFEM